MNLIEFYPTPRTLLDKILDGVDYRYIKNVLEPSSGKGDIVDYIREKAAGCPYYNESIDVDCIELDEVLRNTLIGAGKRVIHDDFLTFSSRKAYDLIIANPPFSEGDKHLSKALDLAEQSGGNLIFILNAETIKNPYSNLRKSLVQRLEDAGATIEYMENEFTSAERQTNVEIAVVKAHFDEPSYGSNILEGLKKKYYPESLATDDISELAPKDPIEAASRAFEIEVDAGIRLIREYDALIPRLDASVGEKSTGSMLKLTCDNENAKVNTYVEKVRLKYWKAVFDNPEITGKMTSDLKYGFYSRLNDLKDYDVTVYNIKNLLTQMNKDLVKGIEDCIIELFDELSQVYSYNPDSKNVHYYNGWTTNKSWIINKKVIIPFYNDVWDRWGTYQPDWYKVKNKLSDIEKALTYLDGGRSDGIDLENTLKVCKKSGQTKDIHLRHFDITFHKKGTVHIVFRDEELLKKFNIFGSQKKGWLPPSYGKKKYSEMSADEKSVIDEFEGEKAYNKVLADKNYYLFDASNCMLQIEEKTA